MINTEGPFLRFTFGARDQVRTGDPQFGKLMLYRLSYSRNKKKLSFYAHRRFRFYRWFVPHHLLCVHHRAGSITEYLESFKLQLGSYSHEVKVPFIRANRTSVRKGSFWASGENRTPISSLEGWSNSLYTTLAFNSLLVLMGGIEFSGELIRFKNSRSPKG